MENGEEEEAGSSVMTGLWVTFPDGVGKKCCDGGLGQHHGVSSIVRWQQQRASWDRWRWCGAQAERWQRRHTSFSRRQSRHLKNFLTGIWRICTSLFIWFVQPAEIRHLWVLLPVNSKQIPDKNKRTETLETCRFGADFPLSPAEGTVWSPTQTLFFPFFFSLIGSLLAFQSKLWSRLPPPLTSDITFFSSSLFLSITCPGSSL